jgi:hypothetical protein
MATQFHMSHPELVSGVGVIAAGPYGCARNSIMTALAECVNKAPNEYPSTVTKLGEQVISLAKHFENDKVWLLHGTLDTRIIAPVSDALHAQYAQITQANNLTYINDKPFAHLFPTLENGISCETSSSPFIGNCGYDAAGEMLSFILSSTNANKPSDTKAVTATLKPKVSSQQMNEQGELITLNQKQLFDVKNTGMNDQGFVYVPSACKNGESCLVHISFHGCNQSIDNIKNQYASNTGLNEWAASNRLVVLYPQIEKSSLMPMNPQACWDWWGYTGEEYLTKDAKQITAVHQMLFSLEDYLNNSLLNN